MEIKHLNKETFESDVLHKKGKVLVDFYATWCPPCKMLSPILEDIAENESLNFEICKLNIDDEMPIAEAFGVMSVPTMILFVDGVEMDRMVGFRNKDQILAFINK